MGRSVLGGPGGPPGSGPEGPPGGGVILRQRLTVGRGGGGGTRSVNRGLRVAGCGREAEEDEGGQRERAPHDCSWCVS